MKNTHLRLIHAFTDLFSERTFEEITVGKLCDLAGVHRTSFYNHFSDLYEFLYFYLLYQQTQIELEASEHSASGDTADYLLTCARLTLSFFTRHSDLVRCGMNSQVLPLILQILTELIRDSVRDRLLSEGKSCTVPVEVTASFYAGGLVHLFRTWLASSERKPEQQLLEELSSMVRHQLK